jgi:site-specific DNA-methyltransferase (adenine-specific)
VDWEGGTDMIEHLAEGVTLYLGDCREILPTLSKVDAVVTDPPFIGLMGGVPYRPTSGVAAKKMSRVTVGDEWGAEISWIDPAWNLCERGMVVFCTYHSVDIVKQAVPISPVGLVTWHKNNAPRAVRNVPRATTELIWLFRKEPGLNWRAIDSGMVDFPNLSGGYFSTGERIVMRDGKSAHPTQKPIALMSWLLRIEPRSICDPFMGSGTTGIAAIRRGIQFIGIERERSYFDIACKRISAALAQPDIFIERPTPPKQESFLP